jgi:hypothetical protein
MAKAAKASAPAPSASDGMNESDFDDMYGSVYLSPDDIKKPTRTTIETVDKEIFDRKETGRSEAKILLTFKGIRKALPLNKTNAQAMASAYGRVPSEWVAKPVLIRVEPTSYAGKPTKGVRIYADDMQGDSIQY